MTKCSATHLRVCIVCVRIPFAAHSPPHDPGPNIPVQRSESPMGAVWWPMASDRARARTARINYHYLIVKSYLINMQTAVLRSIHRSNDRTTAIIINLLVYYKQQVCSVDHNLTRVASHNNARHANTGSEAQLCVQVYTLANLLQSHTH